MIIMIMMIIEDDNGGDHGDIAFLSIGMVIMIIMIVYGNIAKWWK